MIYINTPLEELGLSSRSLNILSNKGAKTLEDVAKFSYMEMLGWQNFGRKSLDEVVWYLREAGDKRLDYREIKKEELPKPVGMDDEKFDIHLKIVLMKANGKTFQWIGDEIGLSKERVRQKISKFYREVYRRPARLFHRKLTNDEIAFIYHNVRNYHGFD